MKNTALIIIDAQIDFCDIATSPLQVPGAIKDLENISKMIENINPQSIFSSLDSHYSLDISHTAWWINADGSRIAPFTPISSDDIKNGKYNAVVDPIGSLRYVEALEANGEFGHFIWPDHCLIGTEGHSLHPTYATALKEWTNKNKRWVNFINKGINPYTEHFGIFRANVPITQDSTTQVNQGMFQTFKNYDTIILGGEARTHCVANSLKQMLEIDPTLASKIVVLEDGMSNVVGLPAGFYDGVDKLYKDAFTLGVKQQKTTDF